MEKPRAKRAIVSRLELSESLWLGDIVRVRGNWPGEVWIGEVVSLHGGPAVVRIRGGGELAFPDLQLQKLQVFVPQTEEEER